MKYLHNKTLSFLLLISIAGLLGGCKKWLDAQPQDKVPQAVLFSSEQGFKDALTGVYLGLDKPTGSSTSIYGSTMTMGILSVMGYDYDNVSNSTISVSGVGASQVYLYNYNDAGFKAEIANVWSSLYNNIANLNNILSQIDKDRSIFSSDSYQRIKGEALALRAMMHFDLVRLFGQPPLTAGTQPAIPYVTTFGVTQTPLSTVNNVLDSCLHDLNAAKNLLATADTTTVNGAVLDPFTSYTQNHLNYWATKGLMSRVFLYKGITDSAAVYAQSVINSGKFPLITKNVALAQSQIRDRTYSQEHLFALYSQNSVGQFENAYFNVGSSITPIQLSSAGRTKRYATPTTDNTDWRLQSWFDVSTNGSTATVPSKFVQDANLPYSLQGLMPLIRVSEMYYIASECANTRGDIPSGVKYINAVRTARGLSAVNVAGISTADSVNHLIQNEYRKEFIQEGQVFFYCKRLNLNLTQAVGTPAILPVNVYVWPLPDAEVQYRGH